MPSALRDAVRSARRQSSSSLLHSASVPIPMSTRIALRARERTCQANRKEEGGRPAGIRKAGGHRLPSFSCMAHDPARDERGRQQQRRDNFERQQRSGSSTRCQYPQPFTVGSRTRGAWRKLRGAMQYRPAQNGEYACRNDQAHQWTVAVRAAFGRLGAACQQNCKHHEDGDRADVNKDLREAANCASSSRNSSSASPGKRNCERQRAMHPCSSAALRPIRLPPSKPPECIKRNSPQTNPFTPHSGNSWVRSARASNPRAAITTMSNQQHCRTNDPAQEPLAHEPPCRRHKQFNSDSGRTNFQAKFMSWSCR